MVVDQKLPKIVVFQSRTTTCCLHDAINLSIVGDIINPIPYFSGISPDGFAAVIDWGDGRVAKDRKYARKRCLIDIGIIFLVCHVLPCDIRWIGNTYAFVWGSAVDIVVILLNGVIY